MEANSFSLHSGLFNFQETQIQTAKIVQVDYDKEKKKWALFETYKHERMLTL